jgi:hypothetical protein
MEETPQDMEDKGKVVPVRNEPPIHEELPGSGGINPRILILATRWRWMLSFTSRSLNSRAKKPRTHWIRGRVGPIAGLSLRGMEQMFSGRPAHCILGSDLLPHPRRQP